jgi:hypothetical protein
MARNGNKGKNGGDSKKVGLQRDSLNKFGLDS